MGATMIKVVAFDAYGTLFDVYSLAQQSEALWPGYGSAIATLWRDKQIEYTRLISLSDPRAAMGSMHYQSFWQLTKISLHYTLERLGLTWTVDQESTLMSRYEKLQAFPENLEVLHALRRRKVATAILSNGTMQMLNSALESAGLTSLFDAVISIESIRQYKIMPATYELVVKRFEVEPAEILFVSSNAWDVLGAQWFGMTTLWINRQDLPFEKLGPRPHFTGTDLTAVLDRFKEGK
jgi:2-haloacid dehalogenase